MFCRLLAGLYVMGVAATTTWAGMVFTVESRSEGGRGSEAQNAVINTAVQGSKMRMDYEESGNPMMEKGCYMVTHDAGQTMYLVNPKKKNYVKWDMQSMMGMAGGMMGMANMQISDPKVEKILDSAGPTVLGYPTRHYKFRTSYTMTMSFMGMKNNNAIVTDEEMWATPKITDMGMDAWKKNQSMRTGNPQLDSLIKAEMEKVKGFPLKRITVTKSEGSRGKNETTSLWEVKKISETSVSDKVFQIPSDYKEEAMMRSLPDESERGNKDESSSSDDESDRRPQQSDDSPVSRALNFFKKR